MRKIFRYLIVLILISSCGQDSTSLDQKIISNTDPIQSVKVNVLQLPFVIGDSILRKSTYAEMKGYDIIDSNLVNQYLHFEYRIDKSKTLNTQAKFYIVGQIKSDNYYGLIYLKSFNPEFIYGGKKDIYRIVTFTKKGRLISQLDIASFDSSTKEGNDYYWNTCEIDTSLRIHLSIKKEEADHANDTAYVIAKLEDEQGISKNGEIVHIKQVYRLTE